MTFLKALLDQALLFALIAFIEVLKLAIDRDYNINWIGNKTNWIILIVTWFGIMVWIRYYFQIDGAFYLFNFINK